MKRIAWGTSKLLWLYLRNMADRDWDYVIDDFTDRTQFEGIPVRRSEQLRNEALDHCHIYVFAVSNESLVAILARLASFGVVLGGNAHLYSDLFAVPFADSVRSQLGWTVDPALLDYSVSLHLNSRKLIHTTLCGSWLFLESVRHLGDIPGDVAEIGCFEGGNALLCLQSSVWRSGKRYYLFDSFEGFPSPSIKDPPATRAGDYATTKLFGEIMAPFAPYRDVQVVKGFVPETFSALPDTAQFSLVFYDCDLYEPALHSFAYFWDRMPPGAMILVHDYFAAPGGFQGVRQATSEFFDARAVSIVPFWHNTMAMAIKR
jgi:hypothetical protein